MVIMKELMRKFYPTYIVEFDIGYGGMGMDGYLYLRYGFQTDSKANTLNIGIIVDLVKTFPNE